MPVLRPHPRLSPRIALTLFALVVCAAILTPLQTFAADPNALWRIVSQQCLPDERDHAQAAPCEKVDSQQGYAVLKDIVGPLQFLLIPTQRIDGMESPILLDKHTPNYFDQAWQARIFMSRKYGKKIDDDDIALAINSATGRTQNQLHIHISCIRPDVKALLNAHSAEIGTQWRMLPDPLRGDRYQARKVGLDEWRNKGAFRILADLPDARKAMGHFGLAMVHLKNGEIVLLATQRHLLTLHLASAEKLQDHACAVLQP